MIPMRTSSIFKSRWMALIWAAGVIWFAYDVAGSAPQDGNAAANVHQPTDVTGAPVTSGDENSLAEVLGR